MPCRLHQEKLLRERSAAKKGSPAEGFIWGTKNMKYHEEKPR
jgi:hypothetical protein